MSTDGMGVLVGMDESACSQQAMAWAAADAVARRVPLTIAGVVDLPRLADVPLSRQLVSMAELAVRQRVVLAARAGRGRRQPRPADGSGLDQEFAGGPAWCRRGQRTGWPAEPEDQLGPAGEAELVA